MPKSINRVAIVGGNHGNELTGVYLVKKFEQYPSLIQRSYLESLTLLGNLKAIETSQRYIETDLNRCFKREDLANDNLTLYEQLRAKEIAAYIQEQKIDLIIDLHSSTANMGLTVILNSNHPFLLKIAAYLTAINPCVKVLQYQPNQDNPYLRGLCELGLAIEVGPVTQGVLDANLFQQTESLVSQILDYIDSYNQGKIPQTPDSCILYEQIAIIDYPRDEQGNLQGMIHPNIQFKDYKSLSSGVPIFLSFDGQEIVYQGRSPVYPVFIGEAAYLEKHISMSLTTKKRVFISG